MAVSTENQKQIIAVQTNNLLINGSFEIGPDPGASLRLLPQSTTPMTPGSTAIQGWTVTRGAIKYVGTYWQASNGNRSLDLDGTPGFGGIAQTFATTPGQDYLVTFDMAGNPEGPPTIKQMRVTAAGQVADFSFNVSGRTRTNMGWQTQTWVFTANSGQTTLEFYSLDTVGGSAGPALDNVLVVTG